MHATSEAGRRGNDKKVSVARLATGNGLHLCSVHFANLYSYSQSKTTETQKKVRATQLIGTTKVLLLLIVMCADLKMQLRKALQRDNAPAKLQNLANGFCADLVKICTHVWMFKFVTG